MPGSWRVQVWMAGGQGFGGGGGHWGKLEAQGQGIVTSRGCDGPSGCVLPTLLPDLTSPPQTLS